MALAVGQFKIGSEGITEDKSGVHLSGTRMVTGLNASASESQRSVEAINATGVERLAEVHPSPELAALGLVVVRRGCTFADKSNTIANVQIVYGPASELLSGTSAGFPNPGIPPIPSTSSNVQGVETSFKLDNGLKTEIVLTNTFGGEEFGLNELPNIGNVHRGGIVVDVEKLAGPPINPQAVFVADITVDQIGKVETQIPFRTTTLTRPEFGSPEDKADAFVGTINAKPFRGKAKHRWLFMDIRGTSEDGGLVYNVEYVLQLHPDESGWDTTAIFKDGGTGSIIRNPGSLAIQDVQTIREADWRVLNL